MPELPEVTTIVNDLNKKAVGRVIKKVNGDTPKLIKPFKTDVFEKMIKDLSFDHFERKAKFIIGYLKRVNKEQPEWALIWHMKMTGHLLFRDERGEDEKQKNFFADPKNQFIRLRIDFADGTHLDFSDLRKFGSLRVVKPDEVENHPALRGLGPDALKYKWTFREFNSRLKKRTIPIKKAIMDQKLIAGIGNIYADEILWESKINPLKPANKLSKEESEKILISINSILKRAVRARGTSIDDFRDASGKKGNFGKLLNVYQRKGEKCLRCGTKIVRISVGGRGTHFCPNCQKYKVKTTKKGS